MEFDEDRLEGAFDRRIYFQALFKLQHERLPERVRHADYERHPVPRDKYVPKLTEANSVRRHYCRRASPIIWSRA